MSKITYDSKVSNFYGAYEKHKCKIEIETIKAVNGTIVDCVRYDVDITLNNVEFEIENKNDDSMAQFEIHSNNYDLMLYAIYTSDIWVQYSGDCADQEHRFIDTSGAYEHIAVEHNSF